MNYYARLAIEALGEQSHVYRYCLFEVFTTVENTKRLKEAYFGDDVPTEAEALVQNLTNNYLQAMEQIPIEACNKILHVLQGAPALPDDGGLLEAFIEAFFDRLFR